MARFETAYPFIEKWEGGLANVKDDKGGLTYAGITYKNFPTWSGWDFILKQLPLPNGTKFPELNDKVKNFYRLAFWDKFGLSRILDQRVANIIFDWLVNSGSLAKKQTEEILSLFKVNGTDWIDKINKVNGKQLYDTIKKRRESFYRSLVEKDSTQAKFLQGWLNRLAGFPVYTVSATVSVLVLLIVAVIFLTLN